MRALLLLLAAGLVLAGCTSTPPPTSPPGSPPAGTPPAGAAPPTITFTASEYNFTGPATAAPGWTTVALRNTGQQLHHMQMIHIGNHSMQEAMGAMMDPNATHPPSWMRNAGGPNAAHPGSTERVVMELQPGTYMMMCFIPGPDGMPHFLHGMTGQFTVQGAPNGASPPAADVTLTLNDFSFTSSTPLTAGTHTVRVTNAGHELHEAPLIRLEGNASAMDFVAAFGPNATGPPPGRGAGGVGTIPPGGTTYAVLTLTPGRYAWLCFEETDDAPHFARGMVHEFTVA